MTYCTYIWRDPKDGTPRYVGEGVLLRPFDHLLPSCKSRLGTMLRKRRREGYDPQPEIILAVSKEDGQEMEMLLIAMIGREDLGTGTLFNKSDGGRCNAGRVITSEHVQKLVVAAKAHKKTPEHMAKSWITRRALYGPSGRH